MELTKRDFIIIRAAIQRNFTPDELSRNGLLDRVPDREMRRQLADVDLEFFVQFYLSDYFSKPAAQMHKELFRELKTIIETPGRMYEVVTWPRGHAKSTIVSFATPLWCVVTQKRHYILLISDSHDQAKGHMSAIKDELDTNERLKEDFGNLKGTKWQEDDIITSNEVRIRALGSGMKIRGRRFKQWRPDLIIIDDPEEIDSVESDKQRSTLDAWFNRSVLKAGMDDTKVFVIGNIIHYDCMVAKLAKNPMFTHRTYKAVVAWSERKDLWDEWKKIVTNLGDPLKKENAEAFFELHKDEMLAGTQTAWPELYSYQDLMLIRVVGGEGAFSMEMQNEPIDPSQRMFAKYGLFRRESRYENNSYIELLVPLNGRPAVRLSDCLIFAGTDPSLGKSNSADPSGIVLIAKAPYGQTFVLETDRKIRTPDSIIQDQLTWARMYPINRWGIEAVQFQAFFASQSARESMEKGVYLPVTPIQQAHRGDKMMRISSLQPDLENEYILVNEHGQYDLKEELEQYPMGANDHLLDALEICFRIAQGWNGLESPSITQGDTYEFGATPPIAISASSQDRYAEMDALAERRSKEQRLEIIETQLVMDTGSGMTKLREKQNQLLKELEQDDAVTAWFPLTIMR